MAAVTTTPARDLALLHIALAYGTDHDLSDDEVRTLTEALTGFDGSLTSVEEIIAHAFQRYVSERGLDEVREAIGRLADGLDETERERALENVVRVAEADGVLLVGEQNLIGEVADAWGLRGSAEDLLAASDARMEEEPTWTLLHDIGLLYIVVGHSADDDLDDSEIKVMVDRLQQWRPELDEESIRQILREALALYADGPEKETLDASVAAIAEKLSFVQRLTVLDDLMRIAEADGDVMDLEREVIGDVSEALGVGLQVR